MNRHHGKSWRALEDLDLGGLTSVTIEVRINRWSDLRKIVMVLQTGQVLNNRYRIVKLLGEGGFGAVYRAWDISFGMPCAIKENTETSPEAQRQFQREAKILHTLRHPNLPLVKDYFVLPDQGQYLVMDYIEGEDLQQMVNRDADPLAEDQVLAWLSVICDALIYLHTQQPPVIHRDIKPANIKITPEGKAVLVDFGIFKLLDRDLPTTQGARAVTPGYAPFEQYGHAPTDARTDIYALGATAYALLTGKTPPDSIARMAGAQLPAPSELNPKISSETEHAILRAMQIMPDDRYPTVEAFYRDLADAGAPLVQNLRSTPESRIAALSPREARSPEKSMTTGEIAEPAIKLSIQEPGADMPPPVAMPKSARPGKPRMSWRWPALFLLGLLVLTVGAYLVFWVLPAVNEEPSPEEPVEPPVIEGMEPGALAGEWEGDIGFMEWPEGRPARLFIEIDPNSNLQKFGGEMVIFHPEGEPEHRGLEGRFEPSEGSITFVDHAGWFYWGWLEGDIFAGELSLDCMHCEVHGGYEFRRR